MPFQILPQAQAGFGANFGKGLGEGLTHLAVEKFKEIAEERSSGKAYKEIKKTNPDMEEGFARLLASDKDLRKQWVKSQLETERNLATQRAINKVRTGGTNQQQPREKPNTPAINQLYQEAGIQAPESTPLQEALQHGPQSALGKLYAEAGLPLEGGPISPESQFPQQEMQQQVQQPQGPRNWYRELLDTPDIPLTDRQREAFEKQAQKEDHMIRKEARELRKESREDEKIIRESFSESAKERAEILAQGRQYREDLKEIQDIEDLEDTGNLDTPGYVAFLERSGLDIPALMNPESEAFQKITTTGMFRGLKDATRGQITNREVEGFAKTIPSLLQSPEGRKRLLAGIKYIKRIGIAYTDGLKDVVSKSIKDHTELPYDWREQIDTKVTKQIDTLAKKFKEDLKRPVPKGQNQYITGLQATAGDLLGGGLSRVGKAAGLAVGGYGVGGIHGAIGGGILGLSGGSLKDLI